MSIYTQAGRKKESFPQCLARNIETIVHNFGRVDLVQPIHGFAGKMGLYLGERKKTASGALGSRIAEVSIGGQ